MNNQGTPSSVRFLLLHAIAEEGDEKGPYKLAVSLDKLEAYREAGKGHSWVWCGQEDPFLVTEGWEVIDGAVTRYLRGELGLETPPPEGPENGYIDTLDPNPAPLLD